MRGPAGGGRTPHYLLGHTEHELRRLDIQGDLYRDITRRAFLLCGIEKGMRVLDVGCGTGDVSVTAAAVTGDTGSVVGIDREEAGIVAAKEKAAGLGLGNVTFEQHEVADFRSDEPFDAVVARFVLMHQSDPAAMLRAVLANVRSGGVVVMIESHMELLAGGAHSEPHSPLYDEIVRWKCEVVGGAGADLRAGGRLRATFLEAGLPEPEMRVESRFEGGPESPYYDYVAESVRSMLPEARRQGIGGFSETDADELADRLRDEVVASRGSLLVWPVVVANSLKPDLRDDPRESSPRGKVRSPESAP